MTLPLAWRSSTLAALKASAVAVALGSVGAAAADAPATTPASNAVAPSPAAIEFFEKKIRPVLADNCFNCHSADTNSKGGLRVDDRNGLLTGGGRGPAIVPGDPDKSLLIKALGHPEKGLKMPPEKPLADEQIADLRRWIQEGAAWTKVEVPDDLGKPDAHYEKLKREHWAWQPLREVAPPAVRDAGWPRDDVDRFVLAKLEEQGLAPVADADRVTLLRRVTYDLTGLPPTPAQLDAFLADTSAGALAAVVDRLLESPAYGERWGRHWLDVARYGESTGSARNLPTPHAWRYRDYVLKSFQDDKPYDQFLREQIAGDLLPANSPGQKIEQLVATGFLAIGVKDVNQRFKVRFVMDNIDEQIDTTSRAVLGLTVSCARCHDHKFDPVPTTDYYALAGIFHSTDLLAGLRNKMGGGGLDYYDSDLLVRIGLDAGPAADAAEKIAAAKKEFEEARSAFQAIFGKPEGKELAADGKPKQFHARQKMNRAQADLVKLTDPALNGPVAYGLRDVKQPHDTEVRVRGEAEKLGPVVPRGFLSLVDVPGAPAVNPAQSGRLQLAEWLASPKNPLTSRVMANRVWQHLFGEGLVRTVDNFGTTGDAPSHPELLDHLARRFVAEGWSVKKLVRSLVLSRAYGLSGDATPAHLTADPANRFVWRHSPRRLDAEEIRDTMLAASGQLVQERPAGSPAQDLRVIELRNNGPEARKLLDAARQSRHRSVYLPLLRTLVPTSLEVFDFAEQGMVTGRREDTTVAPQALYLLNDPFVRRQALTLAERLLARSDVDDAAKVREAYRAILARAATDAEVERARRFVAEYETAAREVFADKQVAAALPPTPAKPNETAPAAGVDVATAANPDDPAPEAAAAEEIVEPASPAAAAWASFCQALLGSAEFRYVK